MPFDGPCSSKYLFVGEAPGAQEDKKLKVFIGKTGTELNDNYLPLAGLRRDSVRIANAISCLPPGPKGKLDPKRQRDLDLLASCFQHHLRPEIERNSYKLIIPMGSFACRAIDEKIDLELDHGRPLHTRYGQVFPMYHPAGGIHEPKKMLTIRTDWVRLRQYLQGKLRVPVDEWEGAEDYRIIRSEGEIDETLHTNVCPLACDTETRRGGKPHCLTYSISPGTGYLIYAENSKLLSRFQYHLDRWQGDILFHNWLFDCEVVKEMGLRFPHPRIVDTMVLCFHLGNLPQGLKALSYRELGMKMQDFYDLVSPHSTILCVDYLRRAREIEWPKPEPVLERDKLGDYRLKKPHSITTKLKTFFTYLAKNPDKDVFEAWDNWENEQELIQERMEERWPGLCITHAPEDKALFYACRDADALCRIYPKLKGMRRNVRRTAQEYWSG